MQRWDKNFIHHSPLLDILNPVATSFANCNRWPNLTELQSALIHHAGTINSLNNAPIRFVHQAPKAKQFEQDYEPRIYLKGEIQTRMANWHDFFNALIWMRFPKTKIAINGKHFVAMQQRYKRTEKHRCAAENALTLFDECGAVIISSDRSLLNLVREFRWKELFWKRRQQVSENFKCIIFGHAIFEKALNPYLGLCVKALLLHSDQDLFLPNEKLDTTLSEFISNVDFDLGPQNLSPFPVLGMPGWHFGNDAKQYYDNTSYFRSQGKKRGRLSPPIQHRLSQFTKTVR